MASHSGTPLLRIRIATGLTVTVSIRARNTGPSRSAVIRIPPTTMTRLAVPSSTITPRGRPAPGTTCADLTRGGRSVLDLTAVHGERVDREHVQGDDDRRPDRVRGQERDVGQRA